MRYIKTYFYQIVFMLLAIVLLVYGLIINCGVMMAISSGLAIMVWFIDSFKNDKGFVFERSENMKQSVVLLPHE